MRAMIRSIVLLLGLLPAAVAHGALLDIDLNGILRGAKGVMVNGSLYDVEFVEGSCAALFDGCDQVTDFTFQNQPDAEAASLALLSQVLLDGPDGNFDSMPELTFGCAFPPAPFSTCSVETAYGSPFLDPILGFVPIAGAYNSDTEAVDGLSLGLSFSFIDSRNSVHNVMARWTAVPAPGVLSCLGAGALALALVRRRRGGQRIR